MTPLAEWLTRRVGLFGGGILAAQAEMVHVERRHSVALDRVHRLLALLDAARDELGDSAAEMEYGTQLLERLVIAKERAETQLVTESLAEQRDEWDRAVLADALGRSMSAAVERVKAKNDAARAV